MALDRSVQFLARSRWVALKQSLGIPRESDKDYFCERIIRAMIAGKIHPETEFTGLLRPGEGFGSQALSRLTVAATAQALGYRYRHTPLFRVGHAEGNVEDWTQRWERVFALGCGELAARESDLPPIDYRDYAEWPSLWRDPYLVSVRDFAAYTKAHPSSYCAYIASRREPLLALTDERTERRGLRVAVHVRRGDVTGRLTRQRFQSNERLQVTLSHLVEALQRRSEPYRIVIHSNGDAESFEGFSMPEVSLAMDAGAIESFGRLASADVLVTAASSFSFLAALLSSGIVIYEEQAHCPLDDWIGIRRDRTFSEEAFRARLALVQR
jgi:hypothetical protein